MIKPGTRGFVVDGKIPAVVCKNLGSDEIVIQLLGKHSFGLPRCPFPIAACDFTPAKHDIEPGARGFVKNKGGL